jgi:hypothetical protein
VRGEYNVLYREPNGDLVVGGRWMLVRLGAKGWSGKRYLGYSTIEAIDGDDTMTWATGFHLFLAGRVGGAMTSRAKRCNTHRDFVFEQVKVAPGGVVIATGWGPLKDRRQTQGWFLSLDRGKTFSHHPWSGNSLDERWRLCRGPGPAYVTDAAGILSWAGSTWSAPTPTTLDTRTIKDLFSFAHTLFAVAGDGWLHRSVDRGATFVKLPLQFPIEPSQHGIRKQLVSNHKGHMLAVGYNNMLARSMDWGDSWEPFKIPGAKGQKYSGALVDEDDTEWVGTCDDAWGALWTTGPRPRRFPASVVRAPPKRRPRLPPR